MKDRPYDEGIAEVFRKDPGLAAELLTEILEDGDQGELLVILRQVALAQGGLQKIAEKAEVNSTHIYRTLSETGNPELRTFRAILNALGFRLTVKPSEHLATSSH